MFSVTPNGKSNHRVPNVKLDMIAYPAPKAHLIVYSVVAGEFTRDLVVANYAGKVKHRYRPPGLEALLSVSPNGKYLGLESCDQHRQVRLQDRHHHRPDCGHAVP